jgi:uncharacterized membrane protein
MNQNQKFALVVFAVVLFVGVVAAWALIRSNNGF